MKQNVHFSTWFRPISFALSNILKIKKSYCIIAFTLNLIDTILPLINVFMLKKVIADLAENKDFNHAIYLAVVIFAVNLILKELQVLISWKEEIQYMEVLDEFAVNNGKKVMEVDFSCLEDVNKLNQISNIYQTQHITGKVVQGLSALICSCIGFLGCAAVIATLHPIFLLILFLAVIITSYINSITMRESNKIAQEEAFSNRQGDYLGKITMDNVTGKEIRTFKLQQYFIDKINSNNLLKLSFNIKRSKVVMKSSFITIIINVLQTAIMYAYISYRYIAGAISISGFSMYLGMATYFSRNMLKITDAFFSIADQYEMLEKYFGYHQLPTTLRDTSKEGINIPKEIEKIEFRNVWFKYPGAKEYVLENINFTMKKGETFSIIGENGAGKTTLIKLLSRLYSPSNGEIYINGININEFPYDDYMLLISSVFQDYKLFAFTIKENMDCAREKEDEEVWKALERAGVKDKIRSLPEGLNSHLFKGKGWDGVELSGGESQKLAIARAYLKNSPLVILDEPTAAVDPIAEYNIYKNFHELVRGKNAIFISHRMSSAKFSDKVLFISHKTIHEMGSHAELIKLHGEYENMYQMQAQYYK